MIEKVVIRYKEGHLLKGYIRGFSEREQRINVKNVENDKEKIIDVDTLKAIFFVRSFEGKSEYREQKKYGISQKKGDRVFVKFHDGELLIGYLAGDVPWDKQKGYYLSKIETDLKGFYLIPVDEHSNNIKVFVLLSAVEDVSVMV